MIFKIQKNTSKNTDVFDIISIKKYDVSIETPIFIGVDRVTRQKFFEILSSETDMPGNYIII